MTFAYLFLATLLYVVALPILLILQYASKYKDAIPARFFLKKNPPFSTRGIWFHACSLGEVRSLTPMLQALGESSSLPLHISVVTQTGYHEAKRLVGSQATRYLPYEIFLPWWIGAHSVLVVMEAELWPMLFYVAKAKGCKTILLNARISDRSYASYQRFAWLYRWIFQHIDVVFAQTQEDKCRLEVLGALHVKVGGNIKTFQSYVMTHQYVKPRDKRVVVLASTHEHEEALILEAIDLRQDDIVVVVPRHPERFTKVQEWLHAYATAHGRSFATLTQRALDEAQIVLCDKMGELINLYAIADVVILGGSFVPNVGGHNPLEPAFFHTKLISGDAVFNQKALFPLVEHCQLCSLEMLHEVFVHSDSILPSRIVSQGHIGPILEEIQKVEHGKSI